MSIVAISETIGSLGDEIGHGLARAVSYQFADREIITKAAERFGRGVMELRHVTEERPTFWERFNETRRRYVTFVEAIILELAARDNVVLSGRGVTVLLQRVPHALRVRITAPEQLRAQRVQERQELTPDAALDIVRQSDRERAARVKFLYHLDWEDPILYDLVINTERFGVTDAVGLVREALHNERLRPTPRSLAEVEDLSLTALAQAGLLADPRTSHLHFSVSCTNRYLSVSGMVEREELRTAAQEIVSRVPGITGVLNEIGALESPRARVYGP